MKPHVCNPIVGHDVFVFVIQGVRLSLHCPDEHCDFPLHPSSLPPLHGHCRYNMSSKMVMCSPSYVLSTPLFSPQLPLFPSLPPPYFPPSLSLTPSPLLPSLSVPHSLPLTFLLPPSHSPTPRYPSKWDATGGIASVLRDPQSYLPGSRG